MLKRIVVFVVLIALFMALNGCSKPPKTNNETESTSTVSAPIPTSTNTSTPEPTTTEEPTVSPSPAITSAPSVTPIPARSMEVSDVNWFTTFHGDLCFVGKLVNKGTDGIASFEAKAKLFDDETVVGLATAYSDTMYTFHTDEFGIFHILFEGDIPEWDKYEIAVPQSQGIYIDMGIINFTEFEILSGEIIETEYPEGFPQYRFEAEILNSGKLHLEEARVYAIFFNDNGEIIGIQMLYAKDESGFVTLVAGSSKIFSNELYCFDETQTVADYEIVIGARLLD